MLIGLATAAASLGSGLLFAATGYIGTAVVSGAVSLVLLALTWWWMTTERRHAVTSPQAPCPESVVLGA
jgi:hypothetical protein